MAQAIAPKPPRECIAVRHVLDGQSNTGDIVSVIGVVSGFREPMETRGTGEGRPWERPRGGCGPNAAHADWKSVIELYDFSVEHDLEQSLELSVFRPKAEMPEVGYGDVVIVSRAKVSRPCPSRPLHGADHDVAGPGALAWPLLAHHKQAHEAPHL